MKDQPSDFLGEREFSVKVRETAVWEQVKGQWGTEVQGEGAQSTG